MTTCTSPFLTDFVRQLKKLVEVVLEVANLAVTIVVKSNAREGAKQVSPGKGLQAVGRTWCLRGTLGRILLVLEVKRRRFLHSAEVYSVYSI
jgi:hypothetical protein